jgi:RNA polymerase sigma factor FliA
VLSLPRNPKCVPHIVLCHAVVEADRDTPESRQLFNEHLELVEVAARKILRSLGGYRDLDSLRSFGQEGLLVAARRFDPARGIPFRAFAAYRVRGAIIDGIRKDSSLPRRTHQKLKLMDDSNAFGESSLEELSAPTPAGQTRAQAQHALDDYLARVATAMAVGLVATTARADDGAVTAVSPSAPPDEQLAQAELDVIVRRLVDDLPTEEAELVRRHYFEGERFDHVAQSLGLSKSWASRLHTRAVSRLTQRIREMGLNERPREP